MEYWSGVESWSSILECVLELWSGILECVLEWNKVGFFCCPSLQKC